MGLQQGRGCQHSTKLTIEAGTLLLSSSPEPPARQRGTKRENKGRLLYKAVSIFNSGYEAEIFPLGFAPAYSRRISFYHKWVRLRSPTPYPGPWHVKSGGLCMGCPSLGTVPRCFPSRSVFCTGLAWFWHLQSSSGVCSHCPVRRRGNPHHLPLSTSLLHASIPH